MLFMYLRTTISFQVIGYTIIIVYFLMLLEQSAPLMLTFLAKSKADFVFHEAGNLIPVFLFRSVFFFPFGFLCG